MPNTVQILPPHVADLIAAGEVVERPASAAKELVENAIDAGASAVTVESAGGGVRLLRVTDNGCGMASGDAERAFLRHATSKIHAAEDLAAIQTLGFRGEALAALAAVSRVRLLTRERGTPLGLALTLEAGAVTAREQVGCPEGTTLAVRDLFYNTPARQKFLKTDQTETAHILGVCQRAALSRPDVSFQYLRDGRQAFLTPGDGQLRSCLYSLFGGAFVGGLCEVSYEAPPVKVWGYVSRPEAAGGSRGGQYVLVSGRPVRARIVTAALEEAYRNALLTGRYPACVLHIDLPPSQYDVNVHPAKSEIKFARDRAVFDAVYFAVKNALGGLDRPVWSQAGAPAPREAFHGTARPRPEAFVQMSSADFRRAPGGPSEPPSSLFPPQFSAQPSGTESGPSRFAARSELPGLSDAPVREAVLTYAAASAAGRQTPVTEEGSGEAVLPAECRFIGEALGGYLLAELSDGLALIDKHAAHERILFNRLKAAGQNPMAQLLMVPLTVLLPAAEAQLLLDKAELLSGMGFALEDFGGGALAVREAPADVDGGDIPALLGDIAVRLKEGRRDPAPRLLDDILHLVACKAAVKLGRASQPEEAERLAAQVLSEPALRHCPHGRPICVVLSRKDLEKQFRR